MVSLGAPWPDCLTWTVEELQDTDQLDTVWLCTLGDLYGVDLERWLDAPAEQLASVAPPVAALLRAQSDTLDSDTRFAIAEATTIARQVRQLSLAVGDEAWRSSLALLAPDHDYAHPSAGGPERLAATARTKLDLGRAHIPSVRGLMERLGIIVLWANLPRDIDALSMANEELGGVIVANARGEHMTNAFLRRVSFAHELCHIFFDRQRMTDVERFCTTGRRVRARADDLEARARAFTMYFLAPRERVLECWTEIADRRIEHRVRAVMERFGVGYEATRHHLRWLELLGLVEEIPRVAPEVPRDWEEADPGAPAYLNRKALDAGLSALRSGSLFDAVRRAYRAGAIGDSRARGELRLTPAAWQELKLAHAGRRDEVWSTSSSSHDERS